MDNQTNRSLAYLLAEPLPDHELETIAGGRPQLSVERTMQVGGDSSQGPRVSLDISLDG